MRRILIFILLGVILLTACVAPGSNQLTTAPTEPVITVFKAPT